MPPSSLIWWIWNITRGWRTLTSNLHELASKFCSQLSWFLFLFPQSLHIYDLYQWIAFFLVINLSVEDIDQNLSQHVYILVGGGWWWVVVDMFWLVVGGGGCGGWWIYFGWLWVVVVGSGWWHNLVWPILNLIKSAIFLVLTGMLKLSDHDNDKQNFSTYQD